MQQERGFSLLELLIASTMLAVALLGVGVLATRAMHDAAALRDHTLAELLIADLRARTELIGSDRLAPGFSGAGIGNAELRDWQAVTRALLPSADSDLCRDSATGAQDGSRETCDGAGPLIVRLTWHRPASVAGEWRQEVLQP